jgi:hypothetical protein
VRLRGPLRATTGGGLRLLADSDEGPVEIELMIAPNGTVLARPVLPVEEAMPLSSPSDPVPVPPEARTTPFRVDDFRAPGADS